MSHKISHFQENTLEHKKISLLCSKIQNVSSSKASALPTEGFLSLVLMTPLSFCKFD